MTAAVPPVDGDGTADSQPEVSVDATCDVVEARRTVAAQTIQTIDTTEDGDKR
jgi:hypothetical protein